jgi:DNA-binding MarR family transcriptional regulator
VAKLSDRALVCVDLKSTQFSLLATLSQCHGISLTRFADIMVMDRTTLTRNLKPLTSKERVVTKPTEDKKIRELFLTPSGEQILNEATPLWRAVQLEMVENLGSERWLSLISNLSDLLFIVTGSASKSDPNTNTNTNTELNLIESAVAMVNHHQGPKHKRHRCLIDASLST